MNYTYLPSFATFSLFLKNHKNYKYIIVTISSMSSENLKVLGKYKAHEDGYVSAPEDGYKFLQF